jgi:hypothetical protein
VLLAHQGGGEPLWLILLEITRYLHVPGAELAPPSPPVQCGPGHVVAIDTPWPNGQACPLSHAGFWLPVAPPGVPPWVLPSARPRALAWAPPRALCRLPRLRPPIEGGDSPFFPSP